MNVEIDRKNIQILSIIGVIFGFSGAAALLYQIIWQRLLFLVFGVDLESVTIIVTVFMLGLGLGGLTGGFVADGLRRYCIHLFLGCEFFIGLFGVCSKWLIDQLSFTDGLFSLFTHAFLMLLIPTYLMGATLPLLSVALIQKGVVVAEAVGRLYYFNTLGAALACFVAGFFIFNYIGLEEVLWLAAVINFSIVLLGTALRVKWL